MLHTFLDFLWPAPTPLWPGLLHFGPAHSDSDGPACSALAQSTLLDDFTFENCIQFLHMSVYNIAPQPYAANFVYLKKDKNRTYSRFPNLFGFYQLYTCFRIVSRVMHGQIF